MEKSFPIVNSKYKFETHKEYCYKKVSIYEKEDNIFLFCYYKNDLVIYILYEGDKNEEEENDDDTKDIFEYFSTSFNSSINSIINFNEDYFFIATFKELFLYKFSINQEVKFNQIKNYKFNCELFQIIEINREHFLLRNEKGFFLLKYFNSDYKIQIRGKYFDYDQDNFYKRISFVFGVNSKKLKFQNVINDFIIFQYNKISFINYITFKTNKILVHERCNLPIDYDPIYCFIDKNKNLVGFNSINYYFFIVDIYKRNILHKFMYPGSLYYNIYSLERLLSDDQYICFYQIRGCFSSNYEVSFCNLFKDDKTFDEAFRFKNQINITSPDIRIISTAINKNKNYIFCQPENQKYILLISLNYK